MTSDYSFSVAPDRDPRRPLIRHITEIDFKGMAKLSEQIKHERLVNKVCNIYKKTWK